MTTAPTPSIFEPARLGPLTLRNRIVKAATFEGVMPRGAVSDDLINFHAEVARGGAAMTTVAYCAVSPGGRVHRDTLVMDERALPGLRRLTDAVHAEGALAAAQIGHAGLVANTLSNKTKTLAPSTRLSPPAMGLVKGATLAELDGVVSDFERTARVAVGAGFDAIEVHLGHNYLLSSFMSPNLNKRHDRYGGSVAKRAEYPRRVVEAVRRAAGSSVAVTAKFNMSDGVPKGLWLDQSLPIAQILEADGHLDAMQLTGGSSLLNGMYFFRGEVPLAEFVASQPKLVGYGLKFYGPKLFPTYPFEEGFFLPFARQFRQALRMPLILLGGINRVDTIEHALDEGFEFVAMARALLRDPQLVNKFQAESVDEGLCIHCNKCMPTIYTGTRCVVRDALVVREAPRPAQ
ncbi:NADH: flavin oxidoreductase [Rhodococcus erythropolis]|uniref:NADH: flavin oxidoreductase n=1 Tax=Rhodococcus erythropolis TaxID=1833 RepID=A0A6G9D309_RHOER|nr:MULTISPECIES: 4,4'-dithiodibutanoate disulfide reductase [Rhodococcus]MCJ0900298.1 4,4'-dithiodibutanoate disulfide reductase [Rhodococcus sp. ARC_M13]QIP43673.1 NADH: flavin oxidoreductase [Rhodococcus erythropolis]UKO86640.1 4,4'-dithiodibutanoate disulfide reductase [Rhodococcus erythropolis]